MNPRFSQLLRDPVLLLAFGFGSGLSPMAPGTMGTLLAIPLWSLIDLLPWPATVAIVVLVCVVGIPVCGIAARKLGVHDHGGIVWDEFAGLFLTLLCFPSLVAMTSLNILVGFLLFRFFDIVKPWPIGWLDRQMRGGTGIMLDDIVAAGFAIATGYLLQVGMTLAS